MVATTTAPTLCSPERPDLVSSSKGPTAGTGGASPEEASGDRRCFVVEDQSKGHDGAPESGGSGASTLAVSSEETPATVAGALSA
jgi:hypothetical protein